MTPRVPLRAARPHRRNPAPLLAPPVAVLLATLLAACSGGAGSATLAPAGRTAPAAATAPEGTAADPAAVLARQAATLHTAVDGLRTGLTVRTTTKLIDERQPCQVSTSDWPAQWIFDQRMYLDDTDARPAGRAVVQRYHGLGWTVTTLPPTADADQYTLSRQGFVISLAAGSGDGSLNVETTGPCVESDGSVSPSAGTPG